jgi:hypothetical protein
MIVPYSFRFITNHKHLIKGKRRMGRVVEETKNRALRVPKGTGKMTRFCMPSFSSSSSTSGSARDHDDEVRGCSAVCAIAGRVLSQVPRWKRRRCSSPPPGPLYHQRLCLEGGPARPRSDASHVSVVTVVVDPQAPLEGRPKATGTGPGRMDTRVRLHS